MTLLTENEIKKQYGVPDINQETNPELNYTFSEAIAPAFRQENVVGSYFANRPFKESFSAEKVDRDFDVVNAVEDRGLTPYLSDFTEIFNEEEFEKRAQKIENQLADREILSNSGWSGVAAQIVAGTFDPINLVPIGGQATKAVKAKTFLQAGIQTAKVAAPSIALQEAALNSTQETRTLGESAVNVTVGTFLSGALGGSIQSIANSGNTFKGLTSKLENDFLKKESTKLTEAEKNLYTGYVNGDSVGAAKAFETTLKQESLAPSLGTAEVTSGLTPMLRLAKSPVKEIREFSQNLIDNPLFFNKNFEGIESPQSVENLRFEQDIRSAKIRSGFVDIFREYKKNARQRGETQLNKKEFNEAVSYAMRNGDIGATDEISKLAKSIRNDVIDPLKERAIDAGLLPEDVSVTTADSYFTRLWSKPKLLADEIGFKKVLKQDFYEKVGGLKRAKLVEFEDKLNKLKSKLDKAAPKQKTELQQRITDLEFEKRQVIDLFEDGEELDDYITDITDSVFNNITGATRTPFAHEVTIAEHGSLKGRTLDIMDNKVQDYLENDAELVLDYYNRHMTGQLLLQEQFGTVNFDKAISDIDEAFNEFKKTQPNDKLEKINKAYTQNKRDLKALWELTNGTYVGAKNYDSLFIKGLQDIRTLNYMRLLGGVTISALPDVGSIVMSHGFKNVFGDLLLPVISNLKKIKPAIEELRSAGLVYEALLNSRVQTLAEIGDPTARGSLFHRSMTNMSTIFTQATMMTQWNDTMKAASGILTQSKILKVSKAFSAGKEIKPNDLAEMKWLGLTDSDLSVISKEFSKHGDSEKGILLSGVNNWENQAVARKFRAALNKSVNATIVTKGLGDTPMFMNTEVGKSVGQFQSFSFAANQRITVRHSQRMAKGDLAVLQGVGAMITMGMLVAYLKAESHKEGITDSWNEDKWILEGIDRSGLVPVMMMFNNPYERIGMPGLSSGLSYATGNDVQPISRYAARGTTEALAGPTFGTIKDTLDTVSSVRSAQLNDKPLNENDIHRLRKLIPFQNLIGLREVFDDAEEYIVEKTK